MNKVICFIGCIGGGKDYQAKEYIKKHPQTKHINFADELREMAWDILGCKPFYGNQYDAFKKTHFRDCGDTEAEISFTGREFLQRLGTEALRKRDPNFWVKCWINKVQEALNGGFDVVCSDCRFENELRFALGLNYAANLHNPCETQFVFCDYHSDRYDSLNAHESEKLAQTIKKSGEFDDLQIIPEQYFRDMFCNCMSLQ